jgi:hypothetical protein
MNQCSWKGKLTVLAAGLFALTAGIVACNKSSSSSGGGISDPTDSNVVVSVTDTGSGAGGSVTSNPGGISCSGTSGSCGYKFTAAQLAAGITLTATANGSSNLVGLNAGFNGNNNNQLSGTCNGNTNPCTFSTTSTQTISVQAAFAPKTVAANTVPGLAAVLEDSDLLCYAADSVDPNAIPAQACQNNNPCQSGSVSTGTFSNNGSSTGQNPVRLSGSLTETFNNCVFQLNNSTTNATITLSGTVTQTWSGVSFNFTPTTDYNNSSWTSIAITGNAGFSASGLSVTPSGGSAKTCGVGENLTYNQTVVQGNGNGSGYTSYSGTSGCVSGQNGQQSNGVVRAR